MDSCLTMTCDDGKPCPFMGQTQQCGWVKCQWYFQWEEFSKVNVTVKYT